MKNDKRKKYMNPKKVSNGFNENCRPKMGSKTNENEGMVTVSIYNLVQAWAESKFIEEYYLYNTNTISDIKIKVSKSLNIPVNAIFFLEEKTEDIVAPILDNTELSQFLSKKDSRGIKLYLGAFDLEEIEEKVKLHNQKFYDIPFLCGYVIQSFGSGNVIGFIEKKYITVFKMKRFIEKVTQLPIDCQILLHRDFVEVTDSMLCLSNVDDRTWSIFVVCTNIKYEEICLKFGIKLFKKFQLKFLTKVENLDVGPFHRVDDVKKFILEKHGIRINKQQLLHKGVELKNMDLLYDLFLKENSMDDLSLNLVIIKETLEINISAGMYSL